jgi:hypothetical protein
MLPSGPAGPAAWMACGHSMTDPSVVRVSDRGDVLAATKASTGYGRARRQAGTLHAGEIDREYCAAGPDGGALPPSGGDRVTEYSTTPTPPPDHDWDWTSTGQYSLDTLASSHTTDVATLLWKTLGAHSQPTTFNPYVNKGQWTVNIPKGIVSRFRPGTNPMPEPGAVMPYLLHQALPKAGHRVGLSTHRHMRRFQGLVHESGQVLTLNSDSRRSANDVWPAVTITATAAAVGPASNRRIARRPHQTRFPREAAGRRRPAPAVTAACPGRMVNRTWLPRTADGVTDGVARAAEACSLGERRGPGGPGGGSPNPWPADHQLDGAGDSQAGPQARLSCCPHAVAPNPARSPGPDEPARSARDTGAGKVRSGYPRIQRSGACGWKVGVLPRTRHMSTAPGTPETGEMCVVVLITQRQQDKRSFVPPRRHLCGSVCPLARVGWWTAAGVR